MSQGSFEGKKHAYRQTQDGIVVSFVIHPNDLNAEFAVAALGTRYIVAFAEIGDDEAPVAQRVAEATFHAEVKPVGEHLEDAGSSPAGSHHQKDRRPFASLPYPQQAALRGNDPEFQRYIKRTDDGGAADEIRLICNVESRSKILPGTEAEKEWLALEARYQRHLTDRQYADARR